VALHKDVANRYPPFDRDAFQAMSDDALRGYEAQLLEFFPREISGRPPSRARSESEPEWLMTGIWITVPPERAEHLSEEARSFANEFSPTPERAPDRDR